MEEDYTDLIGQTIGVIDEEGHEYKTITIKSAKKLGSSWAFVDEEGDLYGEEDLNFRYSLTPMGCFYAVLRKYLDVKGYNISDQDIDKMYNEFVQTMINHGNLRKIEE